MFIILLYQTGNWREGSHLGIKDIIIVIIMCHYAVYFKLEMMMLLLLLTIIANNLDFNSKKE